MRPLKVIKFAITKDTIEEYKFYYFRLFNKRRKFPLHIKETGISFNYFLSLHRLAQNEVKQKWKDFTYWLCLEHNLKDLNLEHCRIEFLFYFDKKTRHDVDNYFINAKLMNDGFVEANVIIDDNSDVLDLYIPPFRYDKESPRLEITIQELPEKEGKNVYRN